MVVRAERLDAAHVEVLRRLSEQSLQPPAVRQIVVVRQRCVRHAVDAEKLGRDALTKAAGVLWVDQQVAFGMGMSVDKPGRDGQPFGVDHPSGDSLRQVADARDPFPPNSNIGPVGRRSRPIHDIPTADDYVEHCHAPRLNCDKCTIEQARHGRRKIS